MKKIDEQKKIKDNFLDICLFFNTNALSRALLKLAEKEFKPLNISPAHASLLLLVFDNPGITPKKLSQYLYLTPSTITRFVDALVKKNLVKRISKGKSAFISPSQKGLELKGAIAGAYKKFYMKYAEIMGSDTAGELSFSILMAHKKIANFLKTNE